MASSSLGFPFHFQHHQQRMPILGGLTNSWEMEGERTSTHSHTCTHTDKGYVGNFFSIKNYTDQWKFTWCSSENLDLFAGLSPYDHVTSGWTEIFFISFNSYFYLMTMLQAMRWALGGLQQWLTGVFPTLTKCTACQTRDIKQKLQSQWWVRKRCLGWAEWPGTCVSFPLC